MRAWKIAGIALALLAAGYPAAAQSPPLSPQPPAPQSKPQPGDQVPAAPDESLSKRLERDGGVIRPPSNIAPDNTIVPDDPGRIRVIPPPGSPQGDSTIRPK